MQNFERGPSVSVIIPTLQTRSLNHLQPDSLLILPLASVPQGDGLPRAVSAPEPRPLGQDQLQLGRGPARDQGPDQGQGVLVKIRLKIDKLICF